MAQKTIQVADKPTLDYIKNKLSNFKIGGMSVVENDLECIMNDNYVNVSISTLPYDFTGSAVVYNNEIHILGGSSNKKAHYKWSGSSWTSVSTLPYEFYGTCFAVVCNNELHILGGTGSNGLHYKWSGSGWTRVSRIPYDWGRFHAVAYNNEIHIFINSSNDSEASYHASHCKWDGSEWTGDVSRLPFNFYGGDIVIYNNEIHMLGGYYGKKEHYKWSGSSWTSVSTLPYQFYYGGSAVVYNNEIHILGGDGGDTKHYKWDGSSWTSVSTLPYGHYYSGLVVYNNEIHTLGGSSSKTAHYVLNEAYKKVALYLLKNQKVYLNKDMSNVTVLTNCTKETSNILVTENGLTEFKVDTTDYRVVLTIKG